MAALAEKDRRALVLRYFEDRSLREVGEVLGVSEEAARQRVWRALEKLRMTFAARGIAFPTSALASTIATYAIHPAPPALAVAVTHAATTAAATSATIPSLSKGAVYLMAWTKTQITVAATAAVLLAGTGATVVYVAKTPKTQTVVIDPKAARPAAAAPQQNAAPGPDLTPEEKTRFVQAYSLADGQSLKRVAPPYIPERIAYMKHVGPSWYEEAKDGNDLVQFTWRGEPQLSQWSRSTATVGGVIRQVLNIPTYKLEMSPADRKRPLKGDWVLRPNTTLEQKITDLTTILHRELNWPVHFEKRSATRPVYVATGTFAFTPAPGDTLTRGTMYCLHWYLGDSVPKQSNGMAAGTLQDLLISLSEHMDREIVDETGSKAQVFWAVHTPDRVVSTNEELLLKNISAQSGITFAIEPRQVEYWALVPDDVTAR